jgi:hypothetical protein
MTLRAIQPGLEPTQRPICGLEGKQLVAISYSCGACQTFTEGTVAFLRWTGSTFHWHIEAQLLALQRSCKIAPALEPCARSFLFRAYGRRAPPDRTRR